MADCNSQQILPKVILIFLLKKSIQEETKDTTMQYIKISKINDKYISLLFETLSQNKFSLKYLFLTIRVIKDIKSISCTLLA